MRPIRSKIPSTTGATSSTTESTPVVLTRGDTTGVDSVVEEVAPVVEGIFDDYTMFRWDFYVHFTNLSNYFCIGIMLAQLIQTARKKEDSYITTAPVLKFIGVLAILLTFVVFNTMLAGAEGRDPQLNWRFGSLLAHVVLPIMYVADWFLFLAWMKLRLRSRMYIL